MRISRNFVTMAGLTMKRCLIHSLRVEKHLGPKALFMRMFSNKGRYLAVNN